MVNDDSRRSRMFNPRAGLFCSALVSAAFPAFSQTYPTRPITMIVPFAVGGPTDTIARIMSERMGKTLGQQIIVENVTGAGGSIAVNKLRSEEHTSELQSHSDLVCRLLLEKKNQN